MHIVVSWLSISLGVENKKYVDKKCNSLGATMHFFSGACNVTCCIALGKRKCAVVYKFFRCNLLKFGLLQYTVNRHTTRLILRQGKVLLKKGQHYFFLYFCSFVAFQHSGFAKNDLQHLILQGLSMTNSDISVRTLLFLENKFLDNNFKQGNSFSSTPSYMPGKIKVEKLASLPVRADC